MPVISDKYDDLFFEKAALYGVPFTWVKAIAGAESDYNPNAYRAEPQINDASRGLMQVLYRTAQALGYQGPPEGLFNPDINVDLGAKLIAENIRRTGENFERVYSMYNSGGANYYKTNPTVARNVARALSYLRAVEATLEQPADTSGDEVPEPEEGPG